ncbi:MAG: hypothetical protein U5M23_00340 [Marinagarivorans sp.]|nr:hypothetical protein [Marinagarivorans sp.]
MPRPTLNSGDIWAADKANSAGYPVLDGADEYGHGPKVVDEWLDDSATSIKANFYGWFGRLSITDGGGLQAAYPSATIMLTNGSVVQLSAGTITLPSNALRFVYVTDAGIVTNAASLPPLGIALALIQTDASSITNLVDLRNQKIEQVRPIAQADAKGFQIGDIKETARTTLESGWVKCDSTLYTAVAYPLAWAEIGRTNSRPNDAPNTFRVPPPCRVYIGAGSAADLSTRTIGQTGGAETVALTEANVARHTHAMSVAPHNHSATSVHSHGVDDKSHTHSMLGSTAGSGGNTDSILYENSAIAGETGGNFGYTEKNVNGTALLNKSTTNLSVLPSSANVVVASADIQGTIAPAGSGVEHENMSPYYVVNKIIRLA